MPEIGCSSHIVTLLKHVIYMICTSPLTGELEKRALQRVLATAPEVKLRPEFGKSRLNLMSLLLRFFVRREESLPSVLDVLGYVQLGSVGGFIRAQRTIKTKDGVTYIGVYGQESLMTIGTPNCSPNNFNTLIFHDLSST